MNVYEKVTARIIEILETGTVPWKKPWISNERPRNLISKKPYRGINAFLLNCSPYSSQYWTTYRQATEKGGHVGQGEKSTSIVFWKWIDCKAAPDEDDNETTGKVPLLRYYNVFNLDQIEGMVPPVEEQPTYPFSPIEQAEKVIGNMQAGRSSCTVAIVPATAPRSTSEATQPGSVQIIGGVLFDCIP